ncbi:hypothetical protein Tco_1096721, partial [Tanacetum coccineum]
GDRRYKGVMWWDLMAQRRVYLIIAKVPGCWFVPQLLSRIIEIKKGNSSEPWNEDPQDEDKTRGMSIPSSLWPSVGMLLSILTTASFCASLLPKFRGKWFSDNNTLPELIDENRWKWPAHWNVKYSFLSSIPIPHLTKMPDKPV